MPHVAIAIPYVPSYSLPFFEGLISKLADDGITLTVFHSPELRQARGRGDVEQPDWSVPVSTREVQMAGRVLSMRRLPRLARRADLLILEQALGKTDALQLLRPLRRSPIALLGQGHIYTRNTRSTEEALLRRLTARDDALDAGLPDDRITVFENSTDTASLASERRSLTDDEVDEVRHRLRIGLGPVLLYLGSIDESKRPVFLKEAMAEVWKHRPDTSLVIVGDGDGARQLVPSDHRVILAGRMTGRPLAAVAASASAIVMPGRVGLVTTDSFALEVPIVTTSWPFHAPEFSYLIDGTNALITPNNPLDYGSALARLLNDDEELDRLRGGCRASSAHYSTENMSELFRQGVLGALEAGALSGRTRVSDRSTHTTPAAAGEADAKVRRLAKGAISRVPPLRRLLLTSTDYELGVTSSQGESGWSTRRAVWRQDRAWRRIVDRALDGEPREDVSALWQALGMVGSGTSIVEVGSGHGYLADLVRHHRPELNYVGVDISVPMCRLALSRRPGASLVVGSALTLPIAGSSVDIVLDGGTLMHVTDWRAALAEEARVAGAHLILHSVTVADTAGAIPMRKYAYGAPVCETVFSRSELAEALRAVGFHIDHQFESLAYNLQDQIGINTVSETWVCTRIDE